MPYFQTEAEVDVEVDEFVSSCSSREIKELIGILQEDGHLSNFQVIPEEKRTIMDDEWLSCLEKLSMIRLTMSEEDIQTIKQISNKY